MANDKSIVEKVEEEAKEIAEKVEKVLDGISADEEPLKVIYPDENSETENVEPKTK